MTGTEKKKGDMVVIKEFFEITASEAIKTSKELTAEDKTELAAGIRDGSLTY